MSTQRAIAKPVAYGIVAVGCTLAVATAFAPQPTGAYLLSGTFMLLGILPYAVYITFSEIMKCCPLLGAGIALLLVDVAVRFSAGITHVSNSDVMPAVYLSLLLTLVVIPLGAAVGKLFSPSAA